MNTYQKAVLSEQDALKILQGYEKYGKFVNDKRARYDLKRKSTTIEVKASFTYPKWKWIIPHNQFKARKFLLLGYKKDCLYIAILIPKHKACIEDQWSRGFRFPTKYRYNKGDNLSNFIVWTSQMYKIE